jgi:prephenate dehydratase
MKVVFQGEPGAYSEQAVFNYDGDVETLPCESFDAMFDSVVAGKSDLALAPIENSLAGSIHQNYDLLLRHDLHIVGEYLLRVRHCLIARRKEGRHQESDKSSAGIGSMRGVFAGCRHQSRSCL